LQNPIDSQSPNRSEGEGEGTNDEGGGGGEASNGGLESDILARPVDGGSIVEEADVGGGGTLESEVTNISISFGGQETVTDDGVGESRSDGSSGIPVSTPAERECTRDSVTNGSLCIIINCGESRCLNPVRCE